MRRGSDRSPRQAQERFNSRTLGRVRHPLDLFQTADMTFQFTHPGKGATAWRTAFSAFSEFQFTHPGKGATLRVIDRQLSLHVSIHAPWEGCDQALPLRPLRDCRVSIHAPWEGCDDLAWDHFRDLTSFNSRTLGRVRRFTRGGGKRDRGFNSRTLGRVRPLAVTACHIRS